MTTFEERAAVIEQLDRDRVATLQRTEQSNARLATAQQQIDFLLRIYIDAITAPLRAFAEEIRR